MSPQTPRTLLFVHAHPDDETLATGVTLAQRVLDGDSVHVLTATLGDEGEVIPPDLQHLTSARDDALGHHRRHELRRAMDILGVVEHVLGEATLGPGHATYRDSGMAGTVSTTHPRAFCRAPLDDLVVAITDHLTSLRPDVVVTYDPRGGYDHPDHLRVVEATCAAVAARPADARPPVWSVVVRASVAEKERAWVAGHIPRGADLQALPADDPYPPNVVPDELVTWDVNGSDKALARRTSALRRHETQVRVGDGWYALSNGIAQALPRQESYVLLDPLTRRLVPPGPAVDPRLAP